MKNTISKLFPSLLVIFTSNFFFCQGAPKPQLDPTDKREIRRRENPLIRALEDFVDMSPSRYEKFYKKP